MLLPLIIDILSGFPVASDGSKCLLVLTEYFLKWVEAYPLPDAEASTCHVQQLFFKVWFL